MTRNCKQIVTPSRATLALLLTFLSAECAVASNIVVIGRLVSNTPMEYVQDCPPDLICMDSWFKSVVQVQKTIQGTPLSGRIVAARRQHTGWNERFKREARLFVLERIEDPAERARLRADYYLRELAIERKMFCSEMDPEKIGLKPDGTYVAEDGDVMPYCFEVPVR